MKESKVICAFPCTGKSSLSNSPEAKNLKILDLDSSGFDKDDFPQNYVRAIKDNLYDYDIILVSTHEEVLRELETNEIRPHLVMPKESDLNEYVGRMYRRGDTKVFIDFIINNWDNFVCKNFFMYYGNVKTIHTLKQNEYLNDILYLYT